MTTELPIPRPLSRNGACVAVDAGRGGGLIGDGPTGLRSSGGSRVWLDGRTIRLADGRSIDIDEDRPRLGIPGPTAALDCHLDLYRWLGGPHAARMARHLTRTAEAARLFTDATLSEYAVARLILARDCVNRATTYYISADMGRIVNGIAAAMADRPEQAPSLKASDVPDPYGILVYAEPWSTMPDDQVMGGLAVLRGLAWRTVPVGGLLDDVEGQPVILTPARDPDDADDDRYGHGHREPPMKQLIDVGGLLLQPFYDARTYFVQGHEMWESWGRPPMIPGLPIAVPYAPIDYHPDYVEAHHVHAHIVALLRLMWQRIIAPEPVDAGRPAGRRWGRRMSRAYKLVQLRRYTPRRPDRADWHDGEPARHLSGTFTVRGHWRDHHYRTLGPPRLPDGSWNEDSHRRIWIDAHLRGEGPPVDARHAVTAVIR